MARFFNVAGPCKPDLHYMIDPLRQLAGACELIDRQSYFVLHAPRQTGKTTSLRALGQALTHEGRYVAIMMSCEVGRAFPEDPAAADLAILGGWRRYRAAVARIEAAGMADLGCS